MAKIMKRALVGFIIGIAASAVISAILADPLPVSSAFVNRIGSPRAAMLLSLLLSGIYGAITIGSVGIYDVERLPLTLSSLLHCLICIVSFVPMALFLGWVSSAAEVIIMTGCQLSGYFIVWLILFIRYKSEVKKLNELQGQIHKDGQS